MRQSGTGEAILTPRGVKTTGDAESSIGQAGFVKRPRRAGAFHKCSKDGERYACAAMLEYAGAKTSLTKVSMEVSVVFFALRGS